MTAPDDLGEWAELYRQARAPSASLRAAVQAQIQAEPEHELHQAAARTTPAQWGLGLALGGLLGVAALLGLTCSLDALRGREAAGPTRDVAPMQSVPAPANASAPPPVSPAPQPLPATNPPASPPVTTPEDSPSQPRPRAPERPEVARGNRDLESLRALRTAEQTLRKDAARARKLLDQHARDYPDSKLWLEREALWISAACRSGGAVGLDKRRSSFALRADVGAYRAAIERDCAAEKESTP